MILKKNDLPGNLLQFSPYIIFLTLYSSLYYYTFYAKNLYLSTPVILEGLPLFAAFITTIYAFFTFSQSINLEKKIEIFLEGVGLLKAIEYYFHIIFIATFNHIVAKTNGVLTAVTLGLLYIPVSCIMLNIFLITTIFGLLVPSLSINIFIFMPIALGIAQSLKINTAFIAATTISGTLFGRHLALYFTKNSLPKPITIKNIAQEYIIYILIAGIITCIIVSQYHCPEIHPIAYNYLQNSLTLQNYITIIPYCFLIITTMLNMNILINLIIACCIALIIEIMLHEIIFLDAIATMFYGFYTTNIVVNILFFSMILTGLAKIIEYNNGFVYIIKKLQSKAQHNSYAAHIANIAIITCINSFILIDTLCFQLLTNPLEQFAAQHNITKYTIKNLLLIITTTVQTILPYASIMFITVHTTNISYIEIMKYMIYPMLIITFIIISTIFHSPIENKKFI